MKSKLLEKIEKQLKNMTPKQGLILSTLSISRIASILEVISLQEGFGELSKFEIFMELVKEKIIHDNKISDDTLDKYINICEELILTLESYQDSNNITEHVSYIMGSCYSIVEELYYFISIQGKEIDDVKAQSYLSFILLPATIIDEYLKASLTNIHKEIHNDTLYKNILIDKEFNRIDEDIRDINLGDLNIAEKKINIYRKLNVLE